MANLLTAIRLLLVVPVAWSIAVPDFIPALLLALFLVVAIATDYFDGVVARATNTSSSRGQLFDHATDFLFVTCGLTAAAIAGLVMPLLPVLIIIAFSQYVLDSHFLYRQKNLHMSFLGRLNGIVYFLPLILIAAARLDPLAGLEDMLLLFTKWLAYLLIASTMASIVDRAIAPVGLKRGRIKQGQGE